LQQSVTFFIFLGQDKSSIPLRGTEKQIQTRWKECARELALF